jgi:hypothetical protein
MGYESHFEVPDIDDSLLRGVDDLNDLLCPDSHPEDYTNRVRFAHHHQGKIRVLLFVCASLSRFFSRSHNGGRFSRVVILRRRFLASFSLVARREHLSRRFPASVGRSVVACTRLHSFEGVEKDPRTFALSKERERDKGGRDFSIRRSPKPNPNPNP